MEWIRLPELGVEISRTPTTWDDYNLFAHATGLPVMPPSRSPFVTGVSADEARTFAHWLGRTNGRSGRLPKREELVALAALAQQGLFTWHCGTGGFKEARRAASNCLSEWLECGPDWNRHELHCIAAPTWLLTAQSRGIRGALINRGYPFVTFQVVRE